MTLTKKRQDQLEMDFRGALISAINQSWTTSACSSGRLIIKFENNEFSVMYDDATQRISNDDKSTGEFWNVWEIAPNNELLHDASDCDELGCDDDCELNYVGEQVSEQADEIIESHFHNSSWGEETILDRITKVIEDYRVYVAMKNDSGHFTNPTIIDDTIQLDLEQAGVIDVLSYTSKEVAISALESKGWKYDMEDEVFS
ncbi:MAG: hypothetical protein HRT88_09675 [Lentisphaeraceae bacterium]|nr:hypothetical protein [Lentisphaeraceae bacterium]